MMSEMMSIPGDLDAHVDFFFLFSLDHGTAESYKCIAWQPEKKNKMFKQFSIKGEYKS